MDGIKVPVRVEVGWAQANLVDAEGAVLASLPKGIREEVRLEKLARALNLNEDLAHLYVAVLYYLAAESAPNADAIQAVERAARERMFEIVEQIEIKRVESE